MTEQEYERQHGMILQAYKAGFITRERAQELVNELHHDYNDRPTQTERGEQNDGNESH